MARRYASPWESPKGFGQGFGKSKSITVSLCAIVKNEAHRIADCLDSAKDFVDEVIVVDTGSTDDTIKIAKQCGAKVFKFAWCDDFAAARNYALSHATGNWILVLDADEKLDPAAKLALRQIMQQPKCIAANLVRQEIGAQQSPYSLVSRLFRRRTDINFFGYYHESIDDSIAKICHEQPSWKVFIVPGVSIQHYGYSDSEISLKGKQEFARRLMHKHLDRFPSDAYMCSKLGALYVESVELDRGMELLELGIDILNRGNNPQPQLQVEFELYYHAAIAHSYKSNWQLAQNFYQQAVGLDVPALVKLPALNNLGNLWQAQGDSKSAISAYQQVTDIAPNFAKGFYNLGIALKASGQLQPALDAYAQAIALDPEYADAYQNLGVVFMHSGQIQQAIAAFTSAIKYHEQQNKHASAQAIRDGIRDLGLV
jgi:glycosyltransferase involved in cell wall biosynthesis